MRTHRRLLAVASILLGSLTLVTATSVAPASAEGDEGDGYASFFFQQYNDGSGIGDLPHCGSPNVNGEEDFARWSVGSSVTDGAHIDIGDVIELTTTIYSRPADGLGDNGPDPLRVNTILSGPYATHAPTTPGFNPVWHVGDDPVGPVGPFGPYGWEFDVNSHPGIVVPTHSDGAYVSVEVRIRATAPGQITLPRIEVSGYDETSSFNFSCPMATPFNWIVDPPLQPTSGPDNARTDASYIDGIDESNGGDHAITIDVLQNDNDPNRAGGPGDPNEVRIADWSQSDLGGTVTCGTAQQQNNGNFFANSQGPCTYTPPLDSPPFANDAFRYRLRSVTGPTRLVTVNIDLADNHRPINGDYQGAEGFTTQFNTADSFQLEPHDPNGDPIVCVPDPVASTNAGVNADCSVTWSAAAAGSQSFSYVACDEHDTLQDGELGTGVARTAGYADEDLDASTSQRCATFAVDVTTASPIGTLILPPRGGTDNDSVDAGYAGDDIGAYTVEIPVLDNDTDGNGPDPSDGAWTGDMELLDADGVIEVDGDVVGTAEVIDLGGANTGDLVAFTPADGFEGPVSLGYRVCEDPAAQTDPYQGLPFCGVGKVNVFVVGNPAPVAVDDEALTSAIVPITDLDVSENDFDAQGQTLECTPGPLTVDPALVVSASIDAQCLVDLTPVVTAAGVAEVTYEVCDVHQLLQPTNPASPYGEDGRDPGDLANRCDTAVLAAEIVAPAPDDPGLLALDPDPACVADATSTANGTAVDVAVLANDTDLALGDVPSPLLVTGAGVLENDLDDVSANGGTLAVSADGLRVRYTPAAGFAGVDTFSYSAEDTLGQGCAALVTVTVAGAAVAGTGTTLGGTLPRTGSDGVGGQLHVAIGLALLGFGFVLLGSDARLRLHRVTA